MKSIYIATTEAGRGVRHVTQFDGRRDFLAYADGALATNNAGLIIRAQNTPIAMICDALADSGPGFGSRWHQRVTRREAIKLARAGASNNLYL